MEENMENLNPVVESFNGLVVTEVGDSSMETVTAELIPTAQENSNTVLELEGTTGLDISKLTDEQRSQLREFQMKMELYNKSRSGHIEGNTVRTNDGINYTVSKSGAYQRLGPPKKSRKAEHRREVANRKSGKD